MDYTDLKRGDVIVMGINPKYSDDSNERIIIIDKIKSNVVFEYMIYTYAELDISSIGVNDLFLEKEEPGYSYKVDDESIDYYTFRLATVEEKIKLYNAIGKHFTEEYDKDWYNHFTDSSYFDIQDYLLDVFCINVSEYDDDLIYPDFINEIHTYIWDKLCKAHNEAMGVPNTVEDKPEMVNKQKFIEKAVKYLEANFPDIENTGGWYKESFINNFRKTMEE
jgi:hypothetical protein